VVTLYGPGSNFLDKKTFKPLVISSEYNEWVREFRSTKDIDLLARKGKVITISLPEVYIPIKTANPFYNEEQEQLSKTKVEKSQLKEIPEVEQDIEKIEPEIKKPGLRHSFFFFCSLGNIASAYG
jgi:hypothetical protein